MQSLYKEIFKSLIGIVLLLVCRLKKTKRKYCNSETCYLLFESRDPRELRIVHTNNSYNLS